MRHQCWNWCAGRLEGIVENTNLTQGTNLEIIELKSIKITRRRNDDKGIITFECPHGRLYLMKVKKKDEIRND